MLSLPNKDNNVKNNNNDNFGKLQSKEKNILQSDLITMQKLKSSVFDYQAETNKLNNEIERLKAHNNRLIEENQKSNIELIKLHSIELFKNYIKIIKDGEKQISLLNYILN
jgi:predicted RNase H-like nuclease (RuvC/YqgF family)